MNYELAKKLKDAGFPHQHRDECYFEITQDDLCNTISLSELIEACEPIGNLFTLSFLEGNGGSGLDKDGNCINDEWIAEQGDYTGLASPTPEEAVANLWLELNK